MGAAASDGRDPAADVEPPGPPLAERPELAVSSHQVREVCRVGGVDGERGAGGGHAAPPTSSRHAMSGTAAAPAVPSRGYSLGSASHAGDAASARGERRSANGAAAEANTKGVDLLRQGHHLEAVRHFKIALSIETGSVQILNNIGLAYAKMQDFGSAYEWYERAYQQDVRDIETLFSLAWVERKRQRFLHAKELFQKVLDMDSNHLKALYLLGDILKTGQDYDGALWHFERLVRLDPQSVEGRVSLAQCYEQGKQYPRAAQLYSNVLQLAPGRMDVIFFLGRVYYLAKQYKQCLAQFERVPDSDPKGFEARTHAAKACRELEDHERAVGNAERAARLRPHPDVMHFLGEECLRLGDEQKAAMAFGSALEMDPNHIPTLLELGQLMFRQSRLAEAEAHFTRLSELDRNSITALKTLALINLKQRKFAASQQCCDAALRLDPLNQDAFWVLAELHRQEQVPGDSRWFLGLRTPPDVSVADICKAIACGYLTRKQVTEALIWLRKMQQYVPSDAGVQEAVSILTRQGNAVNPQEVLDALQSSRHRPASRRSSPEAAPPAPPAPATGSTAAPRRASAGDPSGALASDVGPCVAADAAPADAAAGVAAAGRTSSHRPAGAPPPGRPPEGASDLEALLRRAERAAAAAAGSRGGAAPQRPGGGEDHAEWREVLVAARSALAQRPDDPLALRCAARALVATGGPEQEIRSLARRAAGSGDDAALGRDLHCYLAGCLERERDFAGAERHFAAALSSRPGDESALLGLARVCMQRKDLAKAKQLYEQVSVPGLASVEPLLRLSEFALEAGSAEEAYSLASRAARAAPAPDAAVLLGLGRACAKTGRNEEAVRSFEQGLSLKPGDSSAMMTLATLHKAAGRDQDALVWLKRVLETNPLDYEANLCMAQLHAARKAAGASQALHYFRAALQRRPGVKEAQEIQSQMASVQIAIGSWRDAQQTLESALTDAPDAVDLWRQLLTVCTNLQDAKGQQQCQKRLAQLNGSAPADRVAYGNQLLSEGQRREAREQFEQALKADPDNVEAIVSLATSWRHDPYREDALDEAKRGYERALQLSPTNADALEGAAYCHRKMNDLDQAAMLYQQCLKVKHNAQEPLYYLGEMLYKQHRHAECQHYLARLVDLDGGVDYKTAALYLLAKSYVALDEHEEAAKKATQGLALNPNNPHFRFILALVKNRVGEYDASIASLKEALRHCDSAEGDQLQVDIHDWLAQAYERKGDIDQAMAEIEQALQRDPSHVSSLITKGLVHIQRKQLDQAEIAIRRALAVEANHPLALVRLGYCKLLANECQEATHLLQKALLQRALLQQCGTVALPRSVKGAARIYMALAYMGQQDVEGALLQLVEARKNHRNFSEVCGRGKPAIVKGECEGLAQQLRRIPDLHINLAQAWQLVHLMAKELESDLSRESSSRDITGATAATAAASRLGVSSTGSTAASPVPSPLPSPAGTPPTDTPSASQAFVAARPLGSGAYGAGAVARLNAAAALRPPVLAPAPQAAPPPGASPAVAREPSPPRERRRWAAADAAPPSTPAPQPSASSTARAGVAGGGPLRLDRHEQISMSDIVQKECLGSGGFGAVYRGYFRGQEVAIKKLFCEDGGNISPLQLAELEQEVVALRNLNHPRLVRLVAACLQPPNLCIVMEYLAGGSLHHVLHKLKTLLVISQQARIALQVSEGVAFLHMRTPPVVHRDLKSLNIVLDRSYNAKICDFGLTQSMEKTHITLKEGSNGGSPRYMAPEIYAGKITEKVDVWALGCILVEAFGGPLPYDDCNTFQQILAKILIDKQAPLIPHNLPRGVKEVVEECFQFDVQERCNAQEVYDRLRQLQLVAPRE